MSLTTCPRKKSDMTPCVVTDGILCYVYTPYHGAICVGCERGPPTTGVFIDIEKLKRNYDATNSRNA